MKIKIYTTLLISLCFSVSLMSQKLSGVEKKLIKTIEANNTEAITFLEEVVNINSGTLNAEGVKEVGEVFKKGFDEIGFSTQWIDMPAEMNRAGHLFAET
ncbi:MAG: M20 family peptidase, partial [Eudoraea sp.]